MIKDFLAVVFLGIFFQAVVSKNITIVLTFPGVNFTNFGLILNQALLLSQCPANNYSIKVVPFNETPLYQSPINVNNFQNVYFVFGPDRYFGPTFFQFTGSATDFPFKSAFLPTFDLDLATRFSIMLQVVNYNLQNDALKSVAFILSGTLVDPLEPWKSFNPHKYLSSFRGTLTIFYYNNSTDAVRIANEIKTRGLINMVLDLNFNSSILVLQACNARNILNWRQRWMIFFSLISNLTVPSSLSFPLSQNFTIYDFGQIANVASTYIAIERDVYYSDICFMLMKLMDSYNCNQNNVGTYNLGSGVFTFDGTSITRSSWILQAYQDSGALVTKLLNVGNLTFFSNGTTVMTQPLAQIVRNRTTAQILLEMQSKPFRVAAMIEKPFVYYDQNGKLTGYSIDTINLVLSSLNITGLITTYTLPTGKLTNGVFSGILGILQNGQADIAVGPITYFPQYTNYLNFTTQFKSYFLAVAYYTNTTDQIYQKMFQFIMVFSWEVWVIIIASCFLYAGALTVVNLISPNEARMTLFDSFLFTLGSIIQGVTTALPDKVSGRILVIFWWVFNIAILLAFVANYGSILIYERLQVDITDVSSLLSQTMYSYGTVSNSSVEEYFATSQSQQFQQLYTAMQTIFVGYMSNSTNASMARVFQDTLNVFIYQDAVLNQFKANQCVTINPSTEQLFYAYALVDSDYTNMINTQLYNLTSQGIISQLDAKYFPTIVTPTCTVQSWLGTILNTLDYTFLTNPDKSLNIQKTAGIFVIMLIGIIVSIIVALIEFIVKKCRKKKAKDRLESEA